MLSGGRGGPGSLHKEFKTLSVSEREEDSRMYEGKLQGRGFAEADGEDADSDMICVGTGGSREDNYFDEVVGALEEIIMDPRFVQLQTTFCQRYCQMFDDSEENKLEYTDIFNEYTDTIESFLEQRLVQRVPGFRMDRFAHMCEKRRDEMTADIFDILLSCGDFDEFKFLMLSHKAQQDGAAPLAIQSNR